MDYVYVMEDVAEEQKDFDTNDSYHCLSLGEGDTSFLQCYRTIETRQLSTIYCWSQNVYDPSCGQVYGSIAA